MNATRIVCTALLTLSATAFPARAHCQIPCGIYGDALRFEMLREDITTIEKSIAQVLALSASEPQDANQLVRWIMNKETHCDAFTEIVTSYFMAQRLKPAQKKDKDAYDKYVRELGWLHEMIVFAMKAKQGTDIEACVKLRTLVELFETSYLGAAKHE